MTKDEILGALPQLSQSDLQAVEAVARSLLVKKTSKPVEDKQLWLFDAYCHALGLRQSFESFAASQAGKAFNKATPAALGFIADTFKGYDARVPCLALMRWLVGLAVADMQRGGIPITRPTLADALGRLPEAFDRAYPGYIQSGLAGLVAEKATGVKP